MIQNYISATRVIHPKNSSGQVKIALQFRYNQEIINQIKEVNNSKWSYTYRAWLLPDSEETIKELHQKLADTAILDISKLAEVPPLIPGKKVNEISERILSIETSTKIEKFKHWMLSRRYSESTIGTYVDALHIFLKFYHEKEVSEITNDDLIRFNNEYILKKKLSSSYQNQVVNGVKLFFRIIEATRMDEHLIYRPKREHVLPNVLSKEEVKMILNSLGNLKHKTMLSLIYGCGLRRGELLFLKPESIDSKRKILLIKQGKGRKDRITPLSEKIIEMLREYYLAFKPKVWLFEGQTGGQYSPESLAKVLKLALKKTSITKPVSLHWLRHSYATHLLESGTDLRYIQELLGHNSSRTTEIYTHVSTKNIQNIRSPFDDL